jgi:hypothetical protein
MLAQRDRFALQLPGEAAEIAEDVGGKPSLAPRLRAQRIAGFKHDHARDLLSLSLHLVGDAEEQPAALARRDLAWRSSVLAFGRMTSVTDMG